LYKLVQRGAFLYKLVQGVTFLYKSVQFVKFEPKTPKETSHDTHIISHIMCDSQVTVT